MPLPQAVGLSESHFFFSLISHTVGMRTLGEVHSKVLEVRLPANDFSQSLSIEENHKQREL